LSSAAFDTSALVKLVIDEAGSQAARELWAAAEPPVCCRLAYVEARAALAAARRAERLTKPQLAAAKRGFDTVWGQAGVVEVSEDLILDAAALAERHALRAYDAVHLAAAREARVAAFVSTDDDQLQAAIAEKLVTFDPKTGRTEP
jgi:predicted nucleic acid-binding protein